MKTNYQLPTTRHSIKRGMTILEIVIVLGILAILALVLARPFLAFRDEQVLASAAEQVFAMVNEARADTLAAKNDMQYGVHFESARSVYFLGSVFSEVGVGNEIFSFPARISGTANLNGGGSDVVFARLTGKAAGYGSIVLILNNNGSTTRTIVISEAGAATIVR